MSDDYISYYDVANCSPLISPASTMITTSSYLPGSPPGNKYEVVSVGMNSSRLMGKGVAPRRKDSPGILFLPVQRELFPNKVPRKALLEKVRLFEIQLPFDEDYSAELMTEGSELLCVQMLLCQLIGVIGVLTGVFFLSWSTFGVLWWTLHNTQGHLTKAEQCLANVDTFYAALLFSLETQTTIGFGHRYVNSSCHSAVMLLWVQMMVSLVLDSTMIAIILSKITHPKWRQSTIYFSDALCISKRDDEYVLSLRVADMSTGSMPEAHVRMYLVHSTTDTHGNNCLLMEDLDVGYDCGRDRLILLVPWIIEHRIDSESPLFKKSWHDIQSVHFEVIVLLEGAVEETGSTAQVIQSYTASDIKWGYNFASMLTRKGNKYLSDFDKLNSVIAQPDMPTCSLYELLGEETISESEAPTMMRKRAFSTIYDIPPTLAEMPNEDHA
ncbi:G protein-activated inward rectifier potassium channel 3-like [Convolutriloba macropyga]|uniref:G protein-activated inward rectifier potassium channel 3-like n=1 Tax=Convolutriloba macropyga TaxID=536237 RepID=UPI003F521CA8